MTLVKTGASLEDIAAARREYRRLVAERKRRELDEYEADAELQAADNG